MNFGSLLYYQSAAEDGGLSELRCGLYNSTSPFRGIIVPRSKLIPYLEVLFAVIVWGASFVATKIALEDISPISIVWLRFSMGIIILGIAVGLRKQFALPNKSEWGYFALVGFLAITFHQWLQSNALQTSEASTTAWIVATTPVFMALLGWLLAGVFFILAKLIN